MGQSIINLRKQRKKITRENFHSIRCTKCNFGEFCKNKNIMLRIQKMLAMNYLEQDKVSYFILRMTNFLQNYLINIHLNKKNEMFGINNKN